MDRLNHSLLKKIPLRGLWRLTAASLFAVATTAAAARASEVALQVLKNSGNAVDAAVTAGFALAVTQPRSGNIGGGGFLLYAPGDGSAPEAIDYRETAPAAATETMFQDEDGNVVNERSRFSHKAAGVPGTVAGLAMALERTGLPRDWNRRGIACNAGPPPAIPSITKTAPHRSRGKRSGSRSWPLPFNALLIRASRAFTRAKPPG